MPLALKIAIAQRAEAKLLNKDQQPLVELSVFQPTQAAKVTISITPLIF